MRMCPGVPSFKYRTWRSRRGNILVMAAIFMTTVLGFTALVVDVGYIIVIRSQMKSASDAAALAAGLELAAGYGPGATRTQSDTVTLARTAGQTVAAANRMLDRSSSYLNPTRDLEFGRRVWDSATQKFTYQWGTGPYDCIKASILRDQPMPQGSTVTPPDASLKLFFARALGNQTASCRASTIVALKPAVGIRIDASSSSTADVLPIALDQQTWVNLLAATNTSVFGDSYSYNSTTGAVTSGADGIKEVNIYPYGSSNLPPGNRGTVDFGSSNNSTTDLSRQIRYGINAQDLSYLPNHEIRFDNGPMIINGDTGISAGIKDDLAAIIGRPRAMPLFTSVSGPGNNAMYTIPRLVGIRILYVQLTGSPSQKKVVVQPATMVMKNAITSNTAQTTYDSIFAPIKIVQ